MQNAFSLFDRDGDGTINAKVTHTSIYLFHDFNKVHNIINVVFSYSGTGICDEGYGFVSIRRYSTSIIQTECLTGFSGMEKLNESME